MHKFRLSSFSSLLEVLTFLKFSYRLRNYLCTSPLISSSKALSIPLVILPYYLSYISSSLIFFFILLVFIHLTHSHISSIRSSSSLFTSQVLFKLSHYWLSQVYNVTFSFTKKLFESDYKENPTRENIMYKYSLCERITSHNEVL